MPKISQPQPLAHRESGAQIYRRLTGGNLWTDYNKTTPRQLSHLLLLWLHLPRAVAQDPEAYDLGEVALGFVQLAAIDRGLDARPILFLHTVYQFLHREHPHLLGQSAHVKGATGSRKTLLRLWSMQDIVAHFHKLPGGKRGIKVERQSSPQSLDAAIPVLSALMQKLLLEDRRKRVAKQPVETPKGSWSRPMALTDLADRIFRDPLKWRKLKRVYADRLHRIRRQSYELCLDGLPENLQREIQRA
jgi:hypothetical protein